MDILIENNFEGMLIREVLRSELGYSANLIKKLKFSPDGIKVNGKWVTVRYVLQNGDILSLDIEDKPEDVSPYIIPVDLPIEVIYEDSYVTAVNKPYNMPSHPSLGHKNDTVANALAYKARTPQRGDIVYVQNEQTNDELYVKRIVGMPGETVSFQDGYVYIDGQKLDEAYISDDIETNCDKTFDVPEGCYLVLGDNRENSLDSRYWDNPYVERADIKGKIIVNFPSVF